MDPYLSEQQFSSFVVLCSQLKKSAGIGALYSLSLNKAVDGMEK